MGDRVWGPFFRLLVAQRLKRLPAMQEPWVRSLGQEDPLEKERATHSSILTWRIPWTEEPGGLWLLFLPLFTYSIPGKLYPTDLCPTHPPIHPWWQLLPNGKWSPLLERSPNFSIQACGACGTYFGFIAQVVPKAATGCYCPSPSYLSPHPLPSPSLSLQVSFLFSLPFSFPFFPPLLPVL